VSGAVWASSNFFEIEIDEGSNYRYHDGNRAVYCCFHVSKMFVECHRIPFDISNYFTLLSNEYL